MVLTQSSRRVSKSCFKEFVDSNAIFEFPLSDRSKSSISTVMHAEIWEQSLLQKCNIEVRNGKEHYLGTTLLVDSSISLIATDFLSGSRAYSISATAALCIKESAKRTKYKAIRKTYKQWGSYTFFGYRNKTKSHLDVSPRSSCLPPSKISPAIDYKDNKNRY